MNIRRRRWLGPIVAALAAAGCGGQGEPPSPAAPAVVTGSASKGPLQGASVDFFLLDAAGNAAGPAGPGTVTTDASGRFTVSGLPAGVPVLVKTGGGSYLDESDPEPDPARKRRIAFGPSDSLQAVLPPGASTLAITPYSMALYKKAHAQAAGSNFANVYAAVRLQAQSAFGFDPIVTEPADPITGAGGSRAYAILLGAAAQAINASATGAGHLPGYADVIAFVDDFADGRLDAQSLPEQIRRFRNNNISVYGSTPEPSVNEAALSRPAPVPNSAPTGSPVITGTATEDQTLGVDTSGIADANGLGPFSFQWRRGGTPIGGATLATYVLGDADVGTLISVTVSYVDGAGNAESVTSAAVGPVANVNDAPVITSTIPPTATEDVLYTYNATVSDPDGPGATWSLVSPTHTCGGSINASSGVFTFTPPGPVPPASCVVAVQVSDGIAPPVSQSATVTITAVNDPPTISSFPGGAIFEDGSTGSIDYTIGDDETPDTALTFVATSDNQTLVPDGTFDYTDDGDGDGAFRDLTINPQPNEYGSALITVTVTDGGGLTAVDTFTLTVDPVSDAPESQTFGVQTDQDVAYVFGTAEFNFADPLDANHGDGSDADAFAAVVVNSLPASGTLLHNDGAQDNPITALPYPPIPVADLTLGRFKFMPAPGESGIPYAAFTFQVQDTGSTANGGVIASIAYVLTVDVVPVASTESVLPFLRADGTLEAVDPLAPASPILIEGSVPAAGFEFRTLLRADVAAGVASNLRPARLVYILDTGSTRTLKVANLEAGQSHAPVQVSSHTDVCRINGVAENLADPDASIVRLDTAGANGICEDGGGDDSAAQAYLVPLGTADTDPGTPAGLGHCCGIVGLGDASGGLVGVLSPEDDGGGTTFDLVRRNVADLATPVPVATLELAGPGPLYGSLARGLGEANVYLRVRRSAVDSTFKLLRYNVGAGDLTELYDYGVSTAAGFTGQFDDATHDADNLYFVTADGASIRRVAHAATGPGQTAELLAPVAGEQVYGLQQAGDRLVFGIQGSNRGIYSVPKAGGGVTTLALDSLAGPTFHSLVGAAGSRVFINVIDGSTPDFLARTLNADGSGGAPDQLDAQWAGRTFQNGCDFSQGCEDSVGAQTVFLRRGASGTQADIELVDPVTGVPTGDFLATVFGVTSGPGGFATGFGRFPQFTFFAAAEHTDIWLGDTLAAGPSPPPASLVPIVTNPGDDKWLLFGDDGDEGGGGAVPFGWSLESVNSDTTQGDAESLNGVLSGDGRYLVFQSRATTLVSPSPPSNVYQIYRRDLFQGTTELISRDFSQNPGSGDSTDPAVSHDGRFIAFHTVAPELVGLVPGPQVVRIDTLQPGNVRLVSDACNDACDFNGGTQGRIAISSDGRYVAFVGSDSGLTVPAPDNGTPQAYRADLQTGDVVIASMDPDQTARCGSLDGCHSVTLSGDGRWVAWATAQDTLPNDTNGASDVLLRDMDTGALRLVSAAAGTSQPGDSVEPFISADGSRLAFESAASLVPGDGNAAGDVYVYDIAADALARASTGDLGEGSAIGFAVLPEDGLGAPVLSGDGRYLMFTADLDDLATPVDAGASQPSPYLKRLESVDGAGNYVGELLRGYVGPSGAAFDAAATGTTLDFWGHRLAMHSAATDVVAFDLNGVTDVFAAFHPQFAPDLLRDTDGDGLTDWTEQALGTNPLLTDSDGDGVSDFAEVNRDDSPGDYTPGIDTDPLRADSDGDGVSDGVEDEVGSTPVSANVVLHVSFNGNDANCDGSSWDPYPGTGGPGLACPLASNAGVQAALLSGGADAANTVFVLYEEFGSYGPLALTGAPRQYIALVGSVGPGRSVPRNPATSSFDGGGLQRTLEVSNAIGISVRSLQIVGGSVPAPQMGGGVFLHDTDGVADLTLREVIVSGNSAERGGGVAAINDSQTLRLFDSRVENNTATSTTLAAGGGIYVDDAVLELDGVVVRGNAANGGTGVAQGGGVWISQSFSQVLNARLEANSAFGGAGGAGGGLYVAPGASSTNVTVGGSVLTGNSASGGGSAATLGGGGINVAAGVGFFTLDRSVVADNAADNGPGGGVNLMNGAGVVRHSRLLANQSNRPGAGLHAHVDPGAGTLAIFNNLVVGNVSTDPDADGAGIEIEHNTAAALTLESNTVAYNQAVANTATGQGAGLAIAPSTSPGYTFRNNLVWYNDNATVNDPLSPEPGDNLFAQAPFNAAGNNANEAFAGNAAAMPAVPQFAAGFYLQPGLSTSIDAGDGDALAAGLTAPFTTDPAGLGDGTAPNLAQIDIGFHYDKGAPGTLDAVAMTPPRSLSCASVDTFKFVPRFRDARQGQPGHRVVVELSGVAPVALGSLTTLDPRGSGSRLARDLGDGSYSVTTNGFFPGTADGTFTVYVDEEPPQTFVVTFTNAC